MDEGGEGQGTEVSVYDSGTYSLLAAHNVLHPAHLHAKHVALSSHLSTYNDTMILKHNITLRHPHRERNKAAEGRQDKNLQL